MATLRDDPYGAFNFLVDLGTGQDVAGFSEVTGLGQEISYAEYRAGSDRFNTVRKIPGLTRVGDVTLKRGMAGSLELFEWIKAVRDGQYERRNVVIKLLDEKREPVIAWLLRNAWPKKLEGPNLNATANEVAIESLTLTCERLDEE